MKSIGDRILELVEKEKKGTIFLNQDFSDLGDLSAVRVALHRLVNRGVLTRIANGLYVKPETSKLLNKEVLPSIETIAQAIAKRDNARIMPTGSYALNALGLSNQVPLNAVYYTDGRARSVNVGKRKIVFKRGSLKKLSLKGEISKLVVLAMSDIGKDNLRNTEKEKLLNLLKREDINDLKHDLKLAPQWIAEFMAKALVK